MPTRRTGRLAAAVALALLGGVVWTGCARDRAARRERERTSASASASKEKDDKFVETVAARAPFDLSCPAGEVQVVRLGESALGATGCGRQTSYACLCTYHVWFHCTQAVCSLDGSNIVQPPMLQGEPPPSTPEPLPPT